MNEIGKNLKRIRLLKNMSLKDVGMLLNMSAPAVSKYENGSIVPSSQKIIDFANAYSVKVLELLKTNKPLDMKFDTFRKKQRLQGTNLDLLKEVILSKVSDYIEVIEMNEIVKRQNKLKKYNCYSLEDGELAADNFREIFKLSSYQPISDLINILENIGIVIIEIENTNQKFSDFDGLSEIVNGYPVIVLLNNKDGARQRFTIAHELGHLLLNIKNNEGNEEKVCNKFASALLMPKEAVIREFGNSRSNISFYELRAFKNEYKVSMAAIVYRLKELNIISEYTYKKMNIRFSSMGFKKIEPFPIEREKSYQFKRLVYKLQIDNIISLNRASELLGVSVDEYNNEDNYYRY